MCESSGKVPHQTSASGPGDLGWSACKPWHADPWWFYLILNNQFLQFFYLRLCTLADLVNLGLQLILQGGREGLLYWNITILSFQLNRTIRPTNELRIQLRSSWDPGLPPHTLSFRKPHRWGSPSLLFIFCDPDLIHSSLMFKLLDLFDEPPIHNLFVVEINGH